MKRRNDALDWLVFSLLVASLLPIAQAEEAFAPFLVGVVLAAAGTLAGRISDRNLMSGWVLNGLALLVLLWLGWELLALHTPRALAFAHFLAIIGLLKCVAHREPRDQVVIVVITVLLLVIGAIVSGSIVFAVALGYFLTAGVYALLELHFRTEAAAVAKRQAPARPQSTPPAQLPPLRGLTCLVTGGALAVGVMIFLLFPRAGGSMTGQGTTGWQLSGFSPRVSLGDVGRILPSPRAVMRVQFRQDNQILTPAELGHPYLRGVTREVYAAGVWRSPRENATERILSVGPSDPQWPLIPAVEPGEAGDLVTQRYWLEPGAPPNIFSLYVPVSMRCTQAAELLRRTYDQTLIWRHLRSIPAQFEVTSATRPSGLLRQTLAREREWTQAQLQARWPSDPEQPSPPRPLVTEAQRKSEYSPPVLQLAEQITRRVAHDTRSDRHAVSAKAQAICDYLRSGQYTYSLENLRPRRGRDPLDEFLFHRQSGHCEYFATAMAVLSQAAGLEARLVNGFRPSEFNEVGGFYVVRQSDAHSWVEVYVPGRGWVSFDPTPAGVLAEHSEWAWWWGEAGNWLDYLQFAWATAVVAYDADYRDRFLGMLQGWFTHQYASGESLGILDLVGELIFGPPMLSLWQRSVYWFVLGLILVGLALLGRILQRLLRMLLQPGSSQARSWPALRDPEARFYHQWLRLLAERGLRKPSAATPLEFAGQVQARLPEQAEAEQLAQAFYQLEYGRRPLAGGQKALVARLLGALRARRG